MSGPDHWQCCQCDGLTDDDRVDIHEWPGEITVYSCPKCGHHMKSECCEAGNPGAAS